MLRGKHAGITFRRMARSSTGGLRAPPPLASNPHRFHEDRSEIAYDIAQLARVIAPRRIRRGVSVEISAERGGRAINTSQVINGKRVQVQRRRAFAIHIGFGKARRMCGEGRHRGRGRGAAEAGQSGRAGDKGLARLMELGKSSIAVERRDVVRRRGDFSGRGFGLPKYRAPGACSPGTRFGGCGTDPPPAPPIW